MHPFARAVADFAREQGLFPPGARPLVALSGGPDSCALLLALLEAADAGRLPRPLGAAHFHHGLRAADADEDAAFCAALCARLRLPCVIGLGAVPRTRAALPGRRRSPNDAARRARYAFLEDAAAQAGADVVATGHTADDQAETVLLRILRGTVPDGLGGFRAARALRPGLRVVRPLLARSREGVESYCRDRGVTPRRDPSNEKGQYARARLRALLPALERDFNPRLREALRRLAGAAADDADLLGRMTDALWGRVAAPAPRRVRLDGALRGNTPPCAAACSRALCGTPRGRGGGGRGRAANVHAAEALLLAGGGAADLPGGVRARGDAAGLTLESPPAGSRPRPTASGCPCRDASGCGPRRCSRADWSGARVLPTRPRFASPSLVVQWGVGRTRRRWWCAPRSRATGSRWGQDAPGAGVMADAGWDAASRAAAPSWRARTPGRSSGSSDSPRPNPRRPQDRTRRACASPPSRTVERRGDSGHPHRGAPACPASGHAPARRVHQARPVSHHHPPPHGPSGARGDA